MISKFKFNDKIEPDYIPINIINVIDCLGRNLAYPISDMDLKMPLDNNDEIFAHKKMREFFETIYELTEGKLFPDNPFLCGIPTDDYFLNYIAAIRTDILLDKEVSVNDNNQ